jgi:predicted site-specific integrase-resolvase
MSRLDEYKAAVAEHKTLRAAARSLGVSAEAIRLAFKKAGIPTPQTAGGRPRQRTPEEAKEAERARKRKVAREIYARKKAASIKASQ